MIPQAALIYRFTATLSVTVYSLTPMMPALIYSFIQFFIYNIVYLILQVRRAAVAACFLRRYHEKQRRSFDF